MSNVATVSAKHIFLDVVAFTHQRSVEAQADIVGILNDLVHKALAALALDKEALILLPTGDGMCIVIIGSEQAFDIHLQLAISIVGRVHDHNGSEPNQMRRFAIRVGINENVDNVVTDVNGNRNIAGAGINGAQRTMTFADANQIFVGATVFETLNQRERYMGGFRPYAKPIKHGQRFQAYQYIANGHPGLDTSVPSAFVPPVPERRRLPRTVGYYIALLLANKDFIVRDTTGKRGYACVVLMWYLAEDAFEKERTPDFEQPTIKISRGTREEQLIEIEKAPFWIVADLAHHIEATHLSPFRECFSAYFVASDRGVDRLKEEHSDLLPSLPDHEELPA